MAGIFGVVSDKNCVDDLFGGTSHLQHRAQNFCGAGLNEDSGKLRDYSHKGLLKQQFPMERLRGMSGKSGIASVSSERQPVTEFSSAGSMIICFDGNIYNHGEVRDILLREGASFSGFRDAEEVCDSALVAKILAGAGSFPAGIEKLAGLMMGDYAIVSLTREGVYSARGWGRKPLILGEKNGSYAVSSESNSFVNTGFKIVRDVEPGEIVLLDTSGIHSLQRLDLQPIKYGTFEWIYTSYPPSIIDGRNVADVRMKIGALLAKRYPVEADIVSPVPNSGRWHATGYSHESGIPYEEVFVRYDYSDRSYTPSEQGARETEARTKLIPVGPVISGKRIVLVDDSIVRGTQMIARVETLRENGAKEVHVRIACPPLMSACRFGKSTKKDDDCIARRMGVGEIKELLEVDSLEYACVEDLEEAIGIPRENLCLSCWGF